MAAFHSMIKRVEDCINKVTKVFVDYKYPHYAQKKIRNNPKRIEVTFGYGKHTIDQHWEFKIFNDNEAERKFREFEKDMILIMDLLQKPYIDNFGDGSESESEEDMDTSREQIA